MSKLNRAARRHLLRCADLIALRQWHRNNELLHQRMRRMVKDFYNKFPEVRRYRDWLEKSMRRS